jgi:hypothetical protein
VTGVLAQSKARARQLMFRQAVRRAPCSALAKTLQTPTPRQQRRRADQAREVSRLLRRLAQRTRLALCSGNHNNAGRQISSDRAPWTTELRVTSGWRRR